MRAAQHAAIQHAWETEVLNERAAAQFCVQIEALQAVVIDRSADEHRLRQPGAGLREIHLRRQLPIADTLVVTEAHEGAGSNHEFAVAQHPARLLLE